MALVGLPPAPAAVLVLEVVQAIEARANLLLQRGVIQIDLEPEFVARPACTMIFGRKLDMVCSTQPYGNVVR